MLDRPTQISIRPSDTSKRPPEWATRQRELFETITGFVFNFAGRLVEPGETLTYDGVDLTVETVDTTRIKRMQVIELEPATDDGSGVSTAS